MPDLIDMLQCVCGVYVVPHKAHTQNGVHLCQRCNDRIERESNQPRGMLVDVEG